VRYTVNISFVYKAFTLLKVTSVLYIYININ
jgi:hypothetical protein